ncbi:MAG: carbohydrate kinase [Bacteroidetes bacterium]|nr:carbohydrate kinase [Bacteroidota bacterium]MDA0950667.1 carbohydrate kinase [Bacteroidota bacterium]
MLKVICIGELLIDFVAEHHSGTIQEAPHFSKKAGGAPANVACAVRRLGQSSVFAGAVGRDPFGEYLTQILVSERIDTSFVQRTETFTTLAFVALSKEGERDFYFSRGADAYLTVDPGLNQLFYKAIVHFGSATAFLQGSLNETYHHYLKEAKEKAALISFDPNFRIDLWKSNTKEFIRQALQFIAVSDLCKFSEEEAFLISGKNTHSDAAIFFHDQGSRLVCITLGAQGSFVSLNGEQLLVKSVKASPIDTTAAGDAFVGALLYQLSQYPTPKKVLEDFSVICKMVAFANKAGAFTTQSYGAIEALPYAKDLERF